MKALLISMTLGLGFAASAAHAQVPSAAPVGTTGQCKDGTYSSATSKRGACRGHKGVKEWYAAADANAASAAATDDSAKPSRKSKKKDADTTAAAAPTPAAIPAVAPAGATGQCRDGTYSTSDGKRGACRGHKGVKEWYATAAAAPASATPAPVAPAATAPATPAAAPAPTAAPATTGRHLPPNSATRMAAPGGGAGQVWVNQETRVYHCQGDEWYGKTKKGQYMTEAAATAAGDHPAHGMACAAR